MLGRLVPKGHGFFELFDKMAELSVDACHDFQELLAHPGQFEKYAQKIKATEQHADEVAHHALALLHQTFITPFDRDDIIHLVKRLDDIVDFIDGAAQRLVLYEVHDVPNEMKSLMDTTLDSVLCVQKTVNALNDMKNKDMLLKMVVEINRLENVADQIFRTIMAKLFREEQDLRKLIKLKEVFELLETVTDRCEDVSNVIETIVLEYS